MCIQEYLNNNENKKIMSRIIDRSLIDVTGSRIIDRSLIDVTGPRIIDRSLIDVTWPRIIDISEIDESSLIDCECWSPCLCNSYYDYFWRSFPFVETALMDKLASILIILNHVLDTPDINIKKQYLHRIVNVLSPEMCSVSQHYVRLVAELKKLKSTDMCSSACNILGNCEKNHYTIYLFLLKIGSIERMYEELGLKDSSLKFLYE